MMLKRFISACLLSSVLVTAVARADEQQAFWRSSLSHTAWTKRNGAPSDPSGMVQDRTGMLWLGSTNGLFRFDGVRFGHRCDAPRNLADLYSRSRGEGFGAEVKRRIMLGTYALSSGYYDAYYGSAQKVRTLIQQDFANAFAEVDVIATPSAPTTAFKLGEKIDDPLQMYLNDITTIPVNLAGVPGTDSLEGAYAALGTALGPVIATLFAVGLLASGLASTSVGAYAGAEIMQGLLRVRVPLILRRLVTLIPAIVILWLEFDPTRALVLSQVVLSFGIPFALIPLLHATADRKLMGTLVNRRYTTIVGIAIAAVVIALINSIGNLGGFVAPTVFGKLEKATGSVQYGLYGLAVASVLAAGLVFLVRTKPEA